MKGKKLQLTRKNQSCEDTSLLGWIHQRKTGRKKLKAKQDMTKQSKKTQYTTKSKNSVLATVPYHSLQNHTYQRATSWSPHTGLNRGGRTGGCGGRRLTAARRASCGLAVGATSSLPAGRKLRRRRCRLGPGSRGLWPSRSAPWAARPLVGAPGVTRGQQPGGRGGRHCGCGRCAGCAGASAAGCSLVGGRAGPHPQWLPSRL